MDRSWMYASRLSDEYDKGVISFIEFAERNNPNSSGKFRCPCISCACTKILEVNEIKDHLYVHGFDKGYKKWIWHGESVTNTNASGLGETCGDETWDDGLNDMIKDVEDEVTKKPGILEELLQASEKPLYDGCEKYTLLAVVLRFFNLKAKHGISDKGLTDILEFVKDLLPASNVLPSKTYDAKKILCPLGMGYQKIHACPNDCMLYRHEYESLHACVKCGASRYKKKDGIVTDDDDSVVKGPPAKVLWYLPIIPRLKRLYANPKDAKILTWHADRKTDGKLRHPADSPQWKMIDSKFAEFGVENRNLRLGLCTDGINPHGNLSSKHSSWPVLLVIYNLPPWLCMKRRYIMLSLMISGPKQPGNDIDVYLRPLIDDLKILWSEGVQVFDGYRKVDFTLRAMIFCTINDFPAYGNLSGYSVKGHKACPICEENTCYEQLVHGKKTVYLGHRRFLRRDHPYRRRRKAFNGRVEDGETPLEPLTGVQVYGKVRNIPPNFGKSSAKSVARDSEKSPWKKCSIFFELPYWSSLFVRHCLDVMHIEKNVCDSLIGTLLNIPGKSKDNLNSRLDMMSMGIRPELAPVEKGKRTYLPPSLCNLGKKEKEVFCQCLYDTKVPYGFSSNIKSLVSLQDSKLVGLKSHDCHVLIQNFIPIALRSVLPQNVKLAITNLCLFFKRICAHSIDVDELEKLQQSIQETQCQLEMFFPPSFFDIMIHLPVHIVREIKLCGPVCFRWMYPFERHMKVLKGYVRNRYRPEACIVESYVAEEVLNFVGDYLSEVSPVGVPQNRHASSFICGRGTRGLKVVRAPAVELSQAHFYILNNNEEVEPYIEKHKKEIDERLSNKNHRRKLLEHNATFTSWFEREVEKSGLDVMHTLRWISRRPSPMVITYSAYDINGYCFYTESQDQKSTTQNSGVSLVASAMHYATAKDCNPIDAEQHYYGVIQEIWEIDYGQFRIPVFKCKWFDGSKRGTSVDEFGFILVNFDREGHKNEPFVLASQVKQVFYKRVPNNKDNWHVVFDGRKAFIPEQDEDELFSFTNDLPSIDDGIEDDTFQCTRTGEVEGYWIDTPNKSL